MRKSLITTAVLGALAAPSFVFAADAAPAPDLTVAYNVGLYSQYIFRGMTQTDRKPALQGGIDLTHSSGFYLGMWGSNISWLRDDYGGSPVYDKGGNLELDIFGGYRYSFGDTGLGIDVGALQYWYPGSKGHIPADASISNPEANTTEVYAAANYKWLQFKISDVVSKAAWGFGKYGDGSGEKGRNTYYAEINANIPIGDTISTLVAAKTTALVAQYGDKWTHSISINGGLYITPMAAALRAAGKSGTGFPHNVGAGDGSADEYQRITAGDFQSVTVPEPLTMQGWQIVDEFNRAFNKAKASGYVPVVHLVTKENAGTSTVWDPQNGYAAAYKKIWGK